MRGKYWLERAWLGVVDDVVAGVLVGIEAGRFTRVEVGVPASPDATHLAGLTIPGLANCHSHAFHRALRGRTQRGRGSFWTWREQMYDVAGRLDPDGYYDLAVATYREMAATGFTSVGEFHYLHHGPGGTPYDDANAMGHAIVEAARDAGIRIALLDTVYLAAGVGRPTEGVQARFDDGSADVWAARVSDLRGQDGVVVGAALHSVRAVPRDQIPLVAEWADEREAPLHVHVSEQVAENDASAAAYDLTPTEVLADAGALGPRTSAVHATHLTDRDVAILGGSRTRACFCATTERDLGDGVGPSRRLHDAGAPLTIGTDSHAVVDAFEEMRAVELDERLATRSRGHWSAAELLGAGTVNGQASLGFGDAGRIAVGARADLVTLDTRSLRTGGTGATAETAVFAAGTPDVTQVIADGVVIATREGHADIGRNLDRTIAALWEETR